MFQCFFYKCTAIIVLAGQLCLTLVTPQDCSQPGSSVHGILLARILELSATPFSRDSFWPTGQTQVSHIASLVAQRLKRLPAMWETWVRSLGWEDPLEEEMATHFSTLAWRIPWTEEPGGLQSTGSQRVGRDWTTSPLLLPTMQADSLPSEPPGEPIATIILKLLT